MWKLIDAGLQAVYIEAFCCSFHALGLGAPLFCSWGFLMRCKLSPLLGAFILFATSSALNGQIIANGDFAMPPVLGSGQMAVVPNSGKLLVANPAHTKFLAAISAIPYWLNSFNNIGYGQNLRDAGLMRVNVDGSGADQYAFINNWETRLSQIASHVVASGDKIDASIRVAVFERGAAGRFQLWAGEPLTANPDQFPSDAVLLAEVSVASAGWINTVPDQVVPVNEWTTLKLSYLAPHSGPAIGKKLTMSLITSNGSVGPTLWDDAAVTAAPEPAAAQSAVDSLGTKASVSTVCCSGTACCRQNCPEPCCVPPGAHSCGCRTKCVQSRRSSS